MKILLSLLLTFASLTGAASAQQAAPAATPPQLPPGPLLNPIPDNIQWTITSNGAMKNEVVAGGSPAPADDKTAGKPQLAAKTIVGQNMGDIRHSVTTYGNGSKMEIWKKARAKRSKTAPQTGGKTEVWEKSGSQYVMTTGWKAPVISDASTDDQYDDLGWISEKNFQGIQKVSGVDCLVFRDNILPPGMRITKAAAPLKDLPEGYSQPTAAAVDPESLKIKAVACIEEDRRLPVAVQLGEEITSYKFEPLNPQTPLAPPADVEAAIASRNQQAQAATRKSVQP